LGPLLPECPLKPEERAESASDELVRQEQARIQLPRRRLNRVWAWIYSVPEFENISTERRNAILREANTSFYERWQSWLAIAGWCAYVCALVAGLLPGGWIDLEVMAMVLGVALIARWRTIYIRLYVVEALDPGGNPI
jgi:hypothetical protein